MFSRIRTVADTLRSRNGTAGSGSAHCDMSTSKSSAGGERWSLQHIKELAVIGMCADDLLMETLVLKGGNALDLIHRVSIRASVDVDFSMQADFPGGIEAFRTRVEASLTRTYAEAGLHAFDFRIEPEPEQVSEELRAFWGGYGIEFKLIDRDQVRELGDDLEAMRRNALSLGKGRKFLIDVSRFEYLDGRQRIDFHGYQVLVYSPAMILAEKLRALCQQMSEYGPIVKRGREASSRARDFVDIHLLATEAGVDMTTAENRALLRKVFDAKHVPLEFLRLLPNYRALHEASFPAVLQTLKAGGALREFGFYFGFVLELAAKLQPPGDA